jgi:hypothetical protein
VPAVSIVVPTFRRPHLLTSALRSIQAQTLDDLEVLVCDNAAQPEVAAVVAGLRDARFVHLARPENLGMVANALDGFTRTTGELVMKVDDDDVLHPTCLEQLAAPFAGRPEVTLSASDFAIVDEAGRPQEALRDQLARMTGRDRAPEGYHRPFTALVARGAVHLVSTLLRRTAVDWASVDPRCGPAYDLHLALLAARGAATCHYRRSRLADYRVHSASDTLTRPVGQLEGTVFALQSALDSQEHTDVEVLRAQLAGTGVRLARELVRAGRSADARAVLARTTAPQHERRRVLALAAVPAVVGRAVSLRRAGAARSGAVTGAPAGRR